MPDVWIIHAPKFQNRYPSLGNYVSLQWMALGVLGLADALRSAGFEARVAHLGLERALDPGFDLAGLLRRSPCRLAALSIHFHQQLHDGLRAAAAIKAAQPELPVVLGGLTATFFAEEIVRRFPQVDAVVAGEGEQPLVRLAAAVREGRRDWSGIPNLVWRDAAGGVVRNPERYLATQADLDALEFCDLSLMEHGAEYVRMPKVFTRLRVPPRLRWKASRVLSQKADRTWYGLSVGRGCTTNCSYCGGGVKAHRLLNGRGHVLFRAPDRTLRSIRLLAEAGYRGAYVSFDPVPYSDAYYRALFPRVRAEVPNFGISFSAWALPSREFFDAYGAAFDERSYVALSPETGSETLRRRVRGIYYSNAELLDTLRHCESRGVRTVVFFSLGLPGETREDFDATLRLRDRIARDFRRSSPTAFSIEVEPAAPWHLDPDRYGITLLRRTLDDFLGEQARPDYSSMSSLGYFQREYLGRPVRDAREYARRVMQTKCRHFCDQRALCTAATAVWSVVGAVGMSACGDEPL